MSMKFDMSKRHLWVHGPKPEFEADQDWADRWYVPARTLPLVRKGVDVIVLPGGNEQTLQFAAFCKKMLGINEDHIIWTSGDHYLLDEAIQKEVFGEVKFLVESGSWQMVPYSVTAPFQEWARGVEAEVFGDSASWVSQFGSKAILHGCARIDPSYQQQVFPFTAGVKIPLGWVCRDLGELELGLNLLLDEVERVILKPIHGTTGEGIIREITSFEEVSSYDFPMGVVVLEEELHADRDSEGKVIAPSIQFMGQQLFGAVTDQALKGESFEGNMAPSITSKAFQKEMLEVAEKVLRWLKPQGPGGFDFLSVEGRPVLIDPNVGRFTGAHPAKIFQGLYAPGVPFLSWKVMPRRDLDSFWSDLERRGVAFNPGGGGSGVFPLCYLPGMWGMLVAFGDGPGELLRLKAQAEELLYV